MPIRMSITHAAKLRSLGGARVLEKRDDRRLLEAVLLLLLGVLFGLALLNAQGTGDRSQWLSYIASIHQVGVVETYVRAVFDGVGYAKTDYPGLSFAIFGLIALVGRITLLTDFEALKLSLVLFLLGCAVLMTIWQGRWRPLLGVTIFLMLAINALVLVYLDVYFVFFLVFSFYCFERGKIAWGAVLFAISFFTKWQPIILAPLILLYIVPRRFDLTHLAKLIPGALFVLVIYLLFGNALIVAFIRGTAQDLTFSGKALNFDWLVTALMELPYLAANQGEVRSVGFDEAPELSRGVYAYLAMLSAALRYVCYFTTILFFFFSDRSFLNLLRAAIVCFMSYFMFGHAVHENHACLPAVLGLCWAAMDRSHTLEAVILGVMFNINIVLFYGLSGVGLGFSRVVGWDTSISLAVFNLFFFLLLWVPIARSVMAKMGELRFSK